MRYLARGQRASTRRGDMHAGKRRKPRVLTARHTISYFAVGVDDATGLLRSQVVEIWTLMVVRHDGERRIRPASGRGQEPTRRLRTWDAQAIGRRRWSARLWVMGAARGVASEEGARSVKRAVMGRAVPKRASRKGAGGGLRHHYGATRGWIMKNYGRTRQERDENENVRGADASIGVRRWLVAEGVGWCRWRSTATATSKLCILQLGLRHRPPAKLLPWHVNADVARRVTGRDWLPSRCQVVPGGAPGTGGVVCRWKGPPGSSMALAQPIPFQPPSAPNFELRTWLLIYLRQVVSTSVFHLPMPWQNSRHHRHGPSFLVEC